MCSTAVSIRVCGLGMHASAVYPAFERHRLRRVACVTLLFLDAAPVSLLESDIIERCTQRLKGRGVHGVPSLVIVI